MDITNVEDSEEALFADIMASTSGSAEAQRRVSSSKVEIEKRERRRDGTKQRPVSMTTFPASSAYDKPGSATAAGQNGASRSGFAGLLGRSFPFSRPKAFFSSEQHLPGRVESYNRSHEQLYQVKPLAASQVRFLI